MTYIRGQERFVHEELVQRVRNGLLEGLQYDGVALGGLPWGLTTPLTFVEQPPDPLVAGAKTDVVEPNTVAISEGRLVPDDELEMGSGLSESIHTFFVDVYGETRGAARVIALDVRALLTGKVDGYPIIFPLRNWAVTGKPVIAGHELEIEDVEVDYPAVGNPTKMHWAVIKLTMLHRHP
jgi:hypothetical protein